MAHDLDYYRRQLKVSKHGLDDALETNADSQERISARLAAAQRAAAEAKDVLERTEGRLLSSLKEDNADRKLTVGELNALVVRNAERVRAWEAHQDAVTDAALWQGLLDAWKQRGKDIATQGYLYGGQYFSLSSVGTTSHRQRVREESLDRHANRNGAGRTREAL